MIHQPAYVLHSRPYKETSLQVTLLMPQQGKRFATFRGVRQASKSARQKQAWLQPFQPLQVAWQSSPANQDWLMPSHLEAYGQVHWLQGEANVCGLYLNELLYLCLPLAQPCEGLFVDYSHSLTVLSESQVRAEQAWLLRRFELSLLQALGYPLQAWLAHSAQGFVAQRPNQPIDARANYRLRPESEPTLAAFDDEVWDLPGFALLALQAEAWSPEWQPALAPLKRFFRAHLAGFLAGRPLGTRQLFNALLGHVNE